MRTVQHINTVESTKIRSKCSLSSQTHPVGIWLLLTELELYILTDSENTAYAGVAWILQGFASSHPTTHSVHENCYIVSSATTIQWVRRTHIPMFKPKPPWSITISPSLIPGFRGTKRTNSERAHLTEILWESTQFWANVDRSSGKQTARRSCVAMDVGPIQPIASTEKGRARGSEDDACWLHLHKSCGLSKR